MGWHKLDIFLLGVVFILQGALILRARHMKTTPIFVGYLIIAWLSFIPWLLNGGASQSLSWNVFLAGIKICVALEAIGFVSEWAILLGASVALLVLCFAVPSAYPDFPVIAYYVRICGHLFALAFSVVAVAIGRHAWLLVAYFGSMLLASRIPVGWWAQGHCALMATHACCMIGWLRLAKKSYT